jgi:hypothetical protein
VGDLDPRVADSLLDTLRSEGIAAYASPTPASRGGYLELRLPEKMTDRVYADASQSERAKALYELELADAEHTPAVEPAPDPTPDAVTEPSLAADSDSPPPAAPAQGPTEIDVDAAWKQLLTSLQSPAEAATWPSREDVSAGSPPVNFAADDLATSGYDHEPEDEHFVPPQPPPLPKLRRATILSLAAIIGGILILLTGVDGGDLGWLGIVAIICGGAALVWHVKEGPPTDSGWDDGAVV